ncbi:hypothetical protein [Candidatus Mycoplasma haematominutum]|uniref:Lipoprotein n=1 Tax=Candidatus Mycoplasma haematominutum 'Birmingham 1' TaxID=1116213 RepID=G8C3U1_9MOLU|nr:hypothetical protein [Candidatus Mycoplasma haematominutum]CCE66989.1 hypothetical protein MHM_04710 [Candidatus Mycoplasma haematominutum 'Birmingham 1']
MPFFSKPTVGAACALGSCGAIGTPVALYLQRHKQPSASTETLVGSVPENIVGAPRAVKPIIFTQCSSSNIDQTSAIQLGTSGLSSVCWKSEREDSVNSNKSELAQLLSDIWKDPNQEWAEQRYGNWTNNCSSYNPKWTIFSSGDDAEKSSEEEYLGLCRENKEVKELPFLKKKVESHKTILYICSSDCWKEDQTGGDRGQIALQEEQEGRWKVINFFRESSQN